MISAYNIREEDLETGDLLIVHRPFIWKVLATYLSAIIRFFTGFYNHTDVIVKIYGKLYVLGAVGRGVILISFDKWIRMHHRVFVIAKADRNYSETEVLRHSGKKYDLKTLLFTQPIYILSRWFIKFLFKYFQIKINNNDGFWIGKKGIVSERKVVCSELAALIRHYKNSHKITTMDIVEKEKTRIDFNKVYFT